MKLLIVNIIIRVINPDTNCSKLYENVDLLITNGINNNSVNRLVKGLAITITMRELINISSK